MVQADRSDSAMLRAQTSSATIDTVVNGGANVDAAISLQLRIETPENVVLTYQLAGPSERLVAYLLDFCIRGVLMFGLMIVLMPLSAVFPGSAVGFFFIVWFINAWGYYAISEGFFRGRTFGKYIMGLRVIHQGGYPVTFWPALLRNLVRFVDSMPFLVNGVGFTSMLLTRDFQRLGDLAARTVVITERHVVLPREPIIIEKIEPLPRAELGTYVPRPELLATIDEFLGRRYVLSHERGHEIAAILAERLAERLEFRGDPKFVRRYPMAFLAKVYVTFLRPSDDVPAVEALGRQAAERVQR